MHIPKHQIGDVVLTNEGDQFVIYFCELIQERYLSPKNFKDYEIINYYQYYSDVMVLINSSTRDVQIECKQQDIIHNFTRDTQKN